MSEVDKILFGKLIEEVHQLTETQNALVVKVDCIEKKLQTGRGIVIGLFLAAGAVGSTAGVFANNFIKLLS